MAVQNMSVFTTKLKNKPDLVKSWLFLVNFKFDNKDLEDVLEPEDMLLQARTGSIPGQTFGDLEILMEN